VNYDIRPRRRIFLTGATGYIGAAVLDALVRGGHDVTALVRDNEKARRVTKRGAHAVIGNLAEPESFRSSADAQDGCVHAALDASSGRWPAIERAALETIIAAAKRPRTGGAAMPARYDRDLADLYARLATHPDATGIFHANDEGDERVNDIVGAIKPCLPVKPDVRHVPMDEARHKLGAYADAMALDQVVRSPRAGALGWMPTLHSVAGNAARLLEEWRESRNVDNMV
jgi:nucleoside-diphosphate-sugar epimerase